MMFLRRATRATVFHLSNSIALTFPIKRATVCEHLGYMVNIEVIQNVFVG